jgi:[ribosomal protein S5]-alanine N-acetyltransferase
MRTIAAKGVTLEPQIGAHATELYALLKEPALYRFIDNKGPASEAALRERLARLGSRLSPDGTEHWLNWVVRNAEGAIVGYVQATVRVGGDAEIAYVLGLPFWRRGYAFAACAAMLAELAVSYGVKRATATLDPDNSASLALLRKLGFGLIEEDAAAQEVRYALDLSS